MWRLQKQPFNILYSALVLYALLGFYWQSVRLWTADGVSLVASAAWGYAAVLAIGIKLFSLFNQRRDPAVEQVRFQPVFLVFGFFLIAISDVVRRVFGFYSDPRVLLYIVCLGIPVVAFVYWRHRSQQLSDGFSRLLSWPLLLGSQLLIAILFIQYVDGRMIFSDDHPSFLYRFFLLQQHFPDIPFYNPSWEAGYSAREFFASGIMNVFFLAYPFWYSGIDFSNLQDIAAYNYLIPYLYVFIVPLANYAAARLFRLEHSVAILAALLALGPSLGFFEWLLKYGTLGFCCSMGMIPLGIALCYRLAIDERPPRIWQVGALLIVSYLCISWTLAAFAFVPIACYAAFRYRQTFAPGRRVLIVAFALLFVVGNAPWVTTFFVESKVLSFVSKTELPGAEDTAALSKQTKQVQTSIPSNTKGKGLTQELKKARELFGKINPLLLLFVFPGLSALRSRTARISMASTIGFLFLLAVFGDLLKPQLELRRMIIPAAFLACIPTALALRSLLDAFFSVLSGEKRSPTTALTLLSFLALSLIAGGILLSPVTVAAIYQNRSDEKFVLAPDELEPLVQAVQQHGGEGRTFFAGFILHELGATHHAAQDGGHIAPLAAFTGKPLYAFYYYHSRWATIDPIPASFRDRGRDGIEQFLDLINVSAVVTYKREWALYCLKHADIYQQVFHEGRFRLFVRTSGTRSYFLRGSGKLEHLKNGFVVTPQSEELVVKFRYLPKLKSNYPGGVELFAEPVFQEEDGSPRLQQVHFVGLRVSPELIGTPIRIAYRP